MLLRSAISSFSSRWTMIHSSRSALHKLLYQKQQTAAFSTTSNLIINAVGRDRLGIVADITGKVVDSGGSVGDSQAAKLGSHFSLMMFVTVPKDELDSLKTKLNTMSDMNAAIFEAVEEEGGKVPLSPRIAYTGYFTLEGADNPGIVHRMTTALVKHGLNIDKMETGQEIAPYGGTTLFRIRSKVLAYEPWSYDVSKIREELEQLGESLNCEVSLEDVDDESTSGVFYGG